MLSEEKKLIDYVRSECKEHGIRFVLSNHQAVNTGERCRASGYFDETSLVVAKKSSKWVQTLAHEYCHMCQWLEGEPKISNIYNDRIFKLLGEEIGILKPVVLLSRAHSRLIGADPVAT